MEPFLRRCAMGFGLAIALLLGSCATMSPEECKQARWYEIGKADGLIGAALSVLTSRVEDCAKVDVDVDTEAYRQGRDLGLGSYCRIENAVPLGLSGYYYARVCPPEIDAVFQQRHQVAFAVYSLRTDIHNLTVRTDTLEYRLREISRNEESRLRSATTDVDRSKIHKESDDERQHVRNELSETDRRLRRKRDELRAAEYNLSNLH